MDEIDIDPRVLRIIFQEFKKTIELETRKIGKPAKFTSFTNVITSTEEGYKIEIFGRGHAILGLQDWKQNSIGSGEILDAVIKSYRVKNNNLVYWRSLNEIIKARGDEKNTKKLEAFLYTLFKDQNASLDVLFDSLKPLIKHYDAIAYLFFLKDLNQYIPIKTSHFDRFFDKVGSEFRTSGRCSWENYNKYLKNILWVRDWLEQEGIENVSLIDAHSFCWMAVNWLESHPQPPLSIPLSTVLSIDKGRSQKYLSDNDTSDPSTKSASTKVVDLEQLNKRKQELGNASEMWVKDSEIERLRKIGFLNPEQAVKLVSSKIGLGYDIESRNEDGTPRFIEVKTIQKGSDSITFYISKYELKKGKKLENYWIYCVLNPESNAPEIRYFHIKDLNEKWLTSITYLADIPITH